MWARRYKGNIIRAWTSKPRWAHLHDVQHFSSFQNVEWFLLSWIDTNILETDLQFPDTIWKSVFFSTVWNSIRLFTWLINGSCVKLYDYPHDQENLNWIARYMETSLLVSPFCLHFSFLFTVQVFGHAYMFLCSSWPDIGSLCQGLKKSHQNLNSTWWLAVGLTFFALNAHTCT
jgi:hypothetical protein